MSKIPFTEEIEIICSNVLRNCLMHIAFCKAYEDCDDLIKNQDVSIFLFNSNLNLAVLMFCKVFGTNSEDTHWKTIIPEIYHNDVRNNVISKVFTDNTSWANYHKNTVKFRNNYVNHLTSEAFTIPVPELAKIRDLVIEFFHLIAKLTDQYVLSAGYVEEFYNSYKDKCFTWLNNRQQSNNASL